MRMPKSFAFAALAAATVASSHSHLDAAEDTDRREGLNLVDRAPDVLTDALVDLPYATFLATDVVPDGGDGYYAFRNIPYGQDTSRRRLQKPETPSEAVPGWVPDKRPLSLPDQDEDCLVLDVFAHSPTFTASKKNDPSRPKAPVLVWFHDGNFVWGSKNDCPVERLVKEHHRQSPDLGGVIVCFNYRLGLFGWLPAGKDGKTTSNAGLWDQRLALQWVQKYAALFGGDADRVTVMGVGSGAASILYQTASFDGERDLPFRQAIIVDPMWDIDPPADTLEITQGFVQKFQGKAGPGINELDRVPSEDLRDANRAVVRDSPIGKYTFGPVLDTQLVASHPLAVLKGGLPHSEGQKLYALSYGAFPNDDLAERFGLNVLPKMNNSDTVRKAVERYFPHMSGSSVNHILSTLYPHDFSHQKGYTSQDERLGRILHDGLLACHAHVLKKVRPSATGLLVQSVASLSTAADAALFEGTSNLTGNRESPLGRMLSFALASGPNDVPDRQVQQPLSDVSDGPLFPRKHHNGSLEADGVPEGLQDKRCDWWLELKALPEDQRQTHPLFHRHDQDLERLLGKSAAPPARTAMPALAVGALVIGAAVLF